jgi:DNA-binding CsgD family transcriptional regulator
VSLEAELLELAMLAYEAAAEPAGWGSFLEQYAKTVSADFTVLQTHDLAQPRSRVLNGFGLSSPFAQSYNEHYSKLNVWRSQGRSLFVPGRVNLTEELCPRAVLERSAFYHEYIRYIGSYGIAMVVSREGTGVLNLSAHRHKGQYGEGEREIARFLLPHLNRAWSAHQRLTQLVAAESVLDQLQLGVVFLRTGALATYCNSVADEIFRAEDGLTLRKGVISASDRLAEQRLCKAIEHALSPDRPLGPASVAVPRPSLRRSYQVVAAPLRGRLQQFAPMGAPRAVVFIRDPDRLEPTEANLLVQLYGLTPKEATLTANLAAGESVERAAEKMGMKYQTARTHLRRIFSKTGTSRQAELLLLIARLPSSRND